MEALASDWQTKVEWSGWFSQWKGFVAITNRLSRVPLLCWSGDIRQCLSELLHKSLISMILWYLYWPNPNCVVHIQTFLLMLTSRSILSSPKTLCCRMRCRRQLGRCFIQIQRWVHSLQMIFNYKISLHWSSILNHWKYYFNKNIQIQRWVHIL